MYYRLSDNYRLRGWQHLTSVLINQWGKKVSILSPTDFTIIMLCDGETPENDFPTDKEFQTRLKQLTEMGWIELLNEPKPLLEEQVYQYFDNRYFSSILWSITGKCNFKCRHCYMDAPDAQLGELSLDQIKTTIDQLADCGIRSIHITGGEPFVRPDFWEIIKYMLSREILIEKIYTNGWLLDKSVFEKFEELKIHPAISISFDGLGWHDWMRRVPHAEEKAINALKLCVAHKNPVDVEMCIHKGNVNIMRDTINFLSSVGVPAIKRKLIESRIM